MGKVLITGASGLIGTRLTEMLTQRGHVVAHLGRKKRVGMIPTFFWDIHRGEIDEAALSGVETVIHLAGASVGDQRWTKKRKREILDSRIQSTRLLARYLKKCPTVKTVISASAIGYYGVGLTDIEFTEESNPGKDFLAEVVKAWEAEVDEIQGRRIVKLRIGIVLSEKGGALLEIMKPIQWGIGAPIGSGKQYMSWIHLDDLCAIFLKAVEDTTMEGIYNATGPKAVTNFDLTKSIAKKLNRRLWAPPIPVVMINLLVGEMANIIVQGAVVSSSKIQESGFIFTFKTIDEALDDLFKF